MRERYTFQLPVSNALSSFSSLHSFQFDTFQATGLAMLFSAGTFLYVATMHVLPEVTNMSSGHSHSFSKSELFMLVLGGLLPLLMTLGHHH